MRRFPLRVGNRERKGKSSGELALVCLYRPLHLSDLHRLSTIEHGGTCSSPIPNRRLSAISANNHGILHYALTSALCSTFRDTCYIQLHRGCSQHNHTLSDHISCLSSLRLIRLDPYYSSGSRVRGPCAFPRAIPRGP